ncbi:MAG TPA: ABC transporter permease [Candidatus Acidoferrales bacterium]|nr:ABC transporter permease [Candidatus Acidoferrales bacterium]
MQLAPSHAPFDAISARLAGFTKAVRLLVILLLFGVVVTFVALPIIALFANASLSGFIESLSSEMVAEAIRLSLITTLATLLIVVAFGTPVAYHNARHQYRGKRLIETLIDLPIVLPPSVAGIALLLAFGRLGLLGQYFNLLGINIAFTTTAVILAQIFVSSPFFIRQATTSFEDVDPQYERAARTLGASSAATFFRVTAPIALNGLVSGALLTWARALGEFGATLIFAGNFQGVTQTMPLAIYTALNSDLNAAIYIAIILVVICFSVIISVKGLALREKHVYKEKRASLK